MPLKDYTRVQNKFLSDASELPLGLTLEQKAAAFAKFKAVFETYPPPRISGSYYLDLDQAMIDTKMKLQACSSFVPKKSEDLGITYCANCGLGAKAHRVIPMQSSISAMTLSSPPKCRTFIRSIASSPSSAGVCENCGRSEMTHLVENGPTTQVRAPAYAIHKIIPHDFTDPYLPKFCCRCGTRKESVLSGMSCTTLPLSRSHLIMMVEGYIRDMQELETPDDSVPSSPASSIRRRIYDTNPSPILPQLWSMVGGPTPIRTR